jgi:hypothetical protein
MATLRYLEILAILATLAILIRVNRSLGSTLCMRRTAASRVHPAGAA